MNKQRKAHWETVYRTKRLTEVGWYQPRPDTSIQLISSTGMPKDAKIIDVGGGDSLLAENLIALGYSDITVLDISEAALKRARRRMGDQADRVKWICADAAEFDPPENYAIWHDRACFHFLTQRQEIDRYLNSARAGIKANGWLILGAFSEQGPQRCSGLEVRRYAGQELESLLKPHFAIKDNMRLDHHTPSGSAQNYVFCSFRRTAESNN